MSIFQRETLQSESLQNRFRENRYAFEQVKRHPLLGIGVGSPLEFKQWTRPGRRTKVIYRVYQIHNSYLELWMVYGLLGVVSFAWLSVVFLVRSFLLFMKSRDPSNKYLALGLFAGYVVSLLKAVTGMTLLHSVPSITLTAFMWGIIEVIWRLNPPDRQEPQVAEVPEGTAAVPAGV